jgi:hypothetical protein
MRRFLLTSILCAAILLAPLTVSAASNKYEVRGRAISNGYYYSDMLLGASSGTAIQIDVSVKTPPGAHVDVYIIPYDQFSYYTSGRAFNVSVARENVNSVSFSLTDPDSNSYYLIVDNMNNARASDAINTTNVTVDVVRDNPILSNVQGPLDQINNICYAIAAIIGLVIVLLVVAVFYSHRKKKAQQAQYAMQYQQPGYGPAGQPMYQQPPYNPPPAYPQQQPPYQQPPYQQPYQPPAQQPQAQQFPAPQPPAPYRPSYVLPPDPNQPSNRPPGY